MGPVCLSAPETLEILATELADNVHGRLIWLISLPTFQERLHLLDLVKSEVLPVQAVYVASPAVIVVFIVLFVCLHLLHRLEMLVAVPVGAFHLELVALHGERG